MQNILSKRSSLSIAPWIIMWAVYAGIYLAIKPYAVIAGSFAFLFVNGLNVVLLILFFNFWKQAEKDGLAKRIFLFFVLAHTFVLVDSCTYHIMYNILHIPHAQAPVFWWSLDNIAYIGFLLFKLLAWISILLAIKFSAKKSGLTWLPLILVFGTILLITIHAIKWNTGASVAMSIYDFADKLLEVGCMIAVVFGLVAAKNKGFLYFAIGSLINVATAITLDFGEFAQGYGLSSAIETFWVLGNLLMIYGLLNLSHAKLTNNVQTWVAPTNSIRTQTAYWCFITCIAALVVFFAVIYFLNPNLFF